MTPCDFDPRKLTAYLDGETSAAEAAAAQQHIAGCTACAAEVAQQVALKRSLREARAKFAPSAEFRSRLQRQIAPKPQRASIAWIWLVLSTCAAMLLLGAIWLPRLVHPDAYSEVADLHINTLASANPYDVISSDRHTVKPWFQGRIPFSFNVPEFAGTDFTLLGGKMVYLHQRPGAQLIVAHGQHKISVLIFQASPELSNSFAETAGAQARDTFNVDAWHTTTLQFVVIGDTEPASLDKLAALLREANP